MPEEMLNIESESHITPSEGSQKEAPRPFQPSWVMESQDEFANLHSSLQLRARQLHRAPDSVVTPDYLRGHYQEIEEQILKGDVSEEDADPLMAKIVARIEELDSQQGVRAESSAKKGAAGQPLTAAESQTAELRDIFGRLDPEKEKARWVDVEYSQEFYTRFTPNMEPHFYTRLEETAERAEWDARWRLARAAFWKKVYSAQPDKLIENQDLIELTREQMETLYNIPGVSEAMTWYLEAIIRGGHAIKKNERDEKGKILLECESGEEFEQFRGAMRDSLDGEKDWDRKKRGREARAKRKLSELEKKSADAIAWNLIWCGNLIESFDSRYSVIKIGEEEYRGQERHGGLAPALCSDDLRAVFHPQEKFENKSSSGLEWGAFGKWGQTQTDKIKGEVRFNRGADILVFEGAPSRNKYWKWERTNKTKEDEGEQKRVIRVFAPECYPTISLRSFFEEEGLVESIQTGDIGWSKVGADRWKTSYVTVRMRKAVGLFEYFAGKVPFDERKDKEWVIPLLDIFRRLKLEEKLGERGFHNLKAWAFRASTGGVGKPQKPEVTSPLPFGLLADYEKRLRYPTYGYLKGGFLGQLNGEGLEIR